MKNNYKRGFIIRTLILLVALFILLSYFNIDLRAVFQSESFKRNASYVVEIGKTVWNGYLEKPSQYLWNSIFVAVIKDSFVQSFYNLKAIREGNIDDLKFLPGLPKEFIPQVKAN